ncbi:MAG: 6-pyruvoyl trahydropterin synthase family protein, partial [Anaerolineales bacterium]
MPALLIALRRFHFSAAHQLSSAGLESRLHGHNFSAWVGVTGPVLPDTGLILADADWQTIASVFARYDSRCLNAQLGQVEPTLPNLTRALW